MRGSWVGIALVLAGCSTVSIPVDLDVPLVASPNAEDGRFAIWSGMQSLEAIEAALPEEWDAAIQYDLAGVSLQSATEERIGATLDALGIYFSDDGDLSGDDALLTEFGHLHVLDERLDAEVRLTLPDQFSFFFAGAAADPGSMVNLTATLHLVATVEADPIDWLSHEVTQASPIPLP